MPQASKGKNYNWLIWVVSIAIPGVVALLYVVDKPTEVPSFVKYLPRINATINGLTTLVLIFGLMAIKNGIVFIHRRFMTLAIVLSVIFLISYVIYHWATEPTPYQGEGFMRPLYFFILFSHILLAIAIVPLVLISFVRALSERYDKHKKIARITLPLWLYVTITGVLVYVMLYGK